MPAGDAPKPEDVPWIEAEHMAAVRRCLDECIKLPSPNPDHRQGPYEPNAAHAILADVESGRESVRDALKRFIHKGQLVQVDGVEGQFSYRNGRTGIIVHDLPDEQGRFTIELNDFARNGTGRVEKTWIRLPATNVKLQTGMWHGIFLNYQFENAAEKAGIPQRRPPSATRGTASSWRAAKVK
jgi:hypothetical protein